MSRSLRSKRSILWKNRGLAFALTLLTVWSWPGTSEAAIPVLDGVVGEGLDALISLAGRSQVEALAPWQTATDSQLRSRSLRALSTVRAYARPEGGWRHDSPPELVLLKGDDEAPNAFCSGPTIYVTRPLVRYLTDRELRAVIAHELAHAEVGHLTERMSHGPSALLIQFGRLVRSDWRALTRGEIDSFMRDLWQRGHWAMIEEMLMEATLGQELEADCLAARWLQQMKDRGVDQDPQDIVASLSSLLGVSPRELARDPFNGVRASSLESGIWRSGSCD
jgi:Zn-dependent protease with chaperone function